MFSNSKLLQYFVISLIKGVKMINQYIIVGKLGQGSYAKVKLGFRRINGKEKFFAIKVFSKLFLRKKRKLIKDSSGSKFPLFSLRTYVQGLHVQSGEGSGRNEEDQPPKYH